MALILSHPFRLLPNGAAATAEQQSEAAEAEQIGVLVLTRRGERPLASGFGIFDPAFAGLRATELVAAVAAYGPPVTINNVESTAVSDTVQQVTIEFT
jgi:hypothetical protein